MYERCEGWGRRTHEVLTQEYGLEIGYSTLTQLLRDIELERGSKDATHVPIVVEPGIEMQHDTSPYLIQLGGRKTHLQCAGLYYRFSKVRYVKFYRSFNKFAMKSFFHEATAFWKFVAGRCVIDNTSLAVRCGTGKNAIFHDDMNAFAKRLGFEWLAHELGHSDRKGGKERNFRTLNTSFFPGRSFRSLDDLNHQVFEWATEMYFRRPQEKTKLIPVELWEQEKPHLEPIPDYVEPPYQDHGRGSDKNGYVSMYANYYWVPGSKLERHLKVIEYPGRIKIFRNRQMLIEYPLKPEDVKYQQVWPDGVTAKKKTGQTHLTSAEEEIKIRASGEIAVRYLEFIKSKEGAVHYRNRFIKNLYSLSLRIAPAVFQKALERALSYKINSCEAIDRIAVQMMRVDLQEWPEIAQARNFEQRSAYQDGRITDEPDLFSYSKLLNPTGKGSDDGSG